MLSRINFPFQAKYRRLCLPIAVTFHDILHNIFCSSNISKRHFNSNNCSILLHKPKYARHLMFFVVSLTGISFRLKSHNPFRSLTGSIEIEFISKINRSRINLLIIFKLIFCSVYIILNE